MLSILAEKIHDPRFLRLIKQLLQAGYLEEWRFLPTLSGVPQGGIVSPVLANIYLNQLDHFVETHLIPQYTRGRVRKKNPAYRRIQERLSRARRKGEYRKAKALLRQAQQLPAGDPNDPAYRRLRYVRYADDALFGFLGPREEAEQIKQELGIFLQTTLKLELSQEKTLITHAQTQAARFLGYDLQVRYCNDKFAGDGYRRLNANVVLRVPIEVIEKKRKLYQQGGKPLRRHSLAACSDYIILKTYQDEYRGLVEYYLLANNVYWLHRVQWAAQQSLLHTLAAKYHSSIAKMIKRYRAITQTPHGPRKCFQACLERTGGKKPLIAQFGGIPLRHRKEAVLIEKVPALIRYEQKEVVRRLIAGRCELCEIRDEHCVVHQTRKLADLEKMGKERPRWAHMMLKRRRKTLIVCQTCHHDIHEGWKGNRIS
jgi:hypothetical protein